MTIVYTTIFGGSDSLKQAPSGASRCVCFVDDPSLYAGQTRGWELLSYPAPNPRRTAWHLRCIPHLLFPAARKTIWIDASFTLTDLERLLLDSSGHQLAVLEHHDRRTIWEEARAIVKAGQADEAEVQKQVEEYRQAGFTKQRLSISCILVRENNSLVSSFNETWDEEIRLNPGDNTQLSLDYAAWRVGCPVHFLNGVRKNNPYAVHDHTDHKKRRRPYR